MSIVSNLAHLSVEGLIVGRIVGHLCRPKPGVGTAQSLFNSFGIICHALLEQNHERKCYCIWWSSSVTQINNMKPSTSSRNENKVISLVTNIYLFNKVIISCDNMSILDGSWWRVPDERQNWTDLSSATQTSPRFDMQDWELHRTQSQPLSRGHHQSSLTRALFSTYSARRCVGQMGSRIHIRRYMASRYESLLALTGTNVTSILKNYYSKHVGRDGVPA